LSAGLGFGFRLSPYARFGDADDLIDTVVLGERLGYSTVTLPYHLLPPASPDEPEWTKVWHDQVTLAAYLAGKTSRLLLMPGVLVLPYHSPVHLAKALVTADVMSGGRIRLGVGTGWLKEEFERLGVPFAERGAIADEYIRALRELWTSGSPSFSGRYVSFDDVSFLPRPLDPDRGIPIYVGGHGPRPFRRVAELGDGWFPMTTTADELRRGVEEIKQQMAERGRDPESLWVGCSFQAGSDPQLEALRRNVRLAGAGALAGDGADEQSVRLPVEEIVAGRGALQDAGADLAVVGFGWRDGAELRRELQWFADEVMPAFA
jgi:probable F420-dependent oxidoreductase